MRGLRLRTSSRRPTDVADHEKSGRPDDGTAAQVLGDVKRAAGDVRAARDVYRAAVVAAVAELEQAGVRDPFARVAQAAGVSRQVVRVLVYRARAGRS